VGTGALFAWSLALYYHLCNGVRHMLWDVGVGLNEKKSNMTSALVLLSALGLTVATWWCGCSYL
jgi:succinate dehydrogenase / fumarate reductase cytochrome b subunit